MAPFIPTKLLFGENLQLKPTESTSAYFLTTDKAIITKLDQNIKQTELDITQLTYLSTPPVSLRR